MTKTRNAWIIVEADEATSSFWPAYTAVLPGDGKTLTTIAEGDGVIVADNAGNVARVGRVLRSRSDIMSTTVYFDRVADLYGLPRAPLIRLAAADGRLSAGLLSYLAESRRLDNSRMRTELGVRLRYPDLASGLAACTPDAGQTEVD